MNRNAAPLLDPRVAADISRQVQVLLNQYVPQWKDVDPSTGAPRGLSLAMTGVFSRFAETIIQRLNKSPDKNFLAFLNLLGVSLLPPQPSEVPLQFTLAPASTNSVVIPARTQVAAQPAPGEAQPMIFETERELVVTPAQLTALYVRDPARDLYANLSPLLTSADWTGKQAFQGSDVIVHQFSFRDDAIFSSISLQSLAVAVTIAPPLTAPVDGRSVVWEAWDGAQSLPMPLSSDGTANLTQSGTIQFTNLTNFLSLASDRRRLLCSLVTPITPAATPQTSMVRSSQLPTIQQISLQAALNRSGLTADNAFNNLITHDLSKDIFAIGEKPRFGDVFYLGDSEVFSQTNATITLTINLTDARSGIPHPIIDGQPQLTWEFWNGSGWEGLGTSEASDDGQPANAKTQFKDTSRAFSQDGILTFTFPDPPRPVTVNGIRNYWIRARITGGNYGRDAYYSPVDVKDLTKGYAFFPATYRPPSVKAIGLGYSGSLSAVITMLALTNDFHNSTSSLPCAPFQKTQDPSAGFYMGFTLPSGLPAFPNQTTSLYLQVTHIIYGAAVDNPNPQAPPLLEWEYSGPQGWQHLSVADDTGAFTRPGMIEFLAPDDLLAQSEFGQAYFWLRARWVSGDYLYNPRVSFLLMNATMAEQAVTYRSEILGSSDSSKNQTFSVSHLPILAGQQVIVRETGPLASNELALIQQEEGEDAVTTKLNSAGQPSETWVRWHEVADFYASSGLDRHYTLDHLSGILTFGDGINGKIPPVGPSNIVVASYRVGGGAQGNKPAGVITQLKKTIPYIAKVTNFAPAGGGADAQALDDLVASAPHAIRHRNRAVTVEDFVDLAFQASPEVARARCVPLHNLVIDPDAKKIQSGVVSLTIVPHSLDASPRPSLELINRVTAYLDDHRLPSFDLYVVGPDYVQVNVQVEIALISLDGAGVVQAAVESALAHFLHPLTGGVEGQGWDFGRQPQLSDLYALVESVPGVDHVRTLSVNMVEERPNSSQTDHFLVYSGSHQVTLRFGEE